MNSAKGLVAGLLLAAGAAYGQGTADLDGHLKYRFTGVRNPGDSLWTESAGRSTVDQGAGVRMNFHWRRGAVDARMDYQLTGVKGERLLAAGEVFPESLSPGSRASADGLRLLDLASVISEGEDYALQHRLDRWWFGHSGENTTLRFGRQAVTWGNGLFYTPMDFFNPFDPTGVDKEYKPGDDMVYGQHLMNTGNDLQGVAVVRRDPVNREVEQDQATLAFKYHGLLETSEVDLLAARHFSDQLFGIGGNRELGQALWRGDLVASRTGDDTVFTFVTNLAYSWVWGGKNVSGALEYFFNGFGQTGGDYDPEALSQNPALVQRLARGELFTLARHYVAGSVTAEASPLVLVTPNLFVNLSDQSGLFQVLIQGDVKQDLLLTVAFSVPIGPAGTEFGGIESDSPGRYLSTGPAVFVQLAAYF